MPWPGLGVRRGASPLCYLAITTTAVSNKGHYVSESGLDERICRGGVFGASAGL
jgi:hypothetical protein